MVSAVVVTCQGLINRLRLQQRLREFSRGEFFLDNEDIQFLFDHIDLAELARIQEDGFAHAAEDPSGYAPATPPTPWTTTAACWKSSAKWPAT